MTKWYVNADKCSSYLDEPDALIWTLSRDSEKTGWNTDSGCYGYGLKKADAEELAKAANEIERLRAQVAALREALQKLITHTLDCEKQLDEFHGLGDDAGSGMSSVVCDARAALATGGNDAV